MQDFDPDAAAQPGSGIFGLPFGEAEARLVLLPVPFDATASYRDGAACGPEAILEASMQVDLWDLQTGKAYEQGFFMRSVPRDVAELSVRARAAAQPILDAGGADLGDPDHVRRLAEVESAGEELRRRLRAETAALLAAGKAVGVVGGDHSVPLGAIEAIVDHYGPIGILHIDAHMDLRVRFEGFRYSHASIMANVLEACGDRIESLTQVGIRDVGSEEVERMRSSGGKVRTFFDLEMRRRLARSEPLDSVLRDIIQHLPRQVYISFDIDGLDPALCPGTGTPVPGGLRFDEVCLLLEALHDSGRRLVGFDLCEVSPRGDQWNANVGSRVLYKLCGFTAMAAAL